MTFDLFANLLTFGLGLAIGVLLGRPLFGGNTRIRQLEQQLEASKSDHVDYQEQINNHFGRTAELVNNLTNAYQDVHEHLSVGAQQLANKHLSANEVLPNLKVDNTQLDATEEAEVTEAANIEQENTVKEQP